LCCARSSYGSISIARPDLRRPPQLRVGIDVGGTFTDFVAVDAATRTLLAAIKVPTTHDHPDGVAAGIVEGLERLLREHAIDPQTIAFIAHSTTQATNALLEGDLARVGIVRIGGAFARWSMRFAPISLGSAGAFRPRFYNLASGLADSTVLLRRIAADGIEALAASAAFAVDRPEAESRVVAAARAAGIAATSGGEVSTMYGLRARTRTAAINAAILPRMLRTSRVTKRAVEASRIPVPLMIMRSDGGVMDVDEVERRPILTLLSGPAAGIAGALFAENVTDGIFIEVGGTSADCSVIKRGQPQMRPARIGGYRTLLRTLDVRTLAIAGGSLVRIEAGRVVDVGPRSAHIAGMRYAAFTAGAAIAAARVNVDDGVAALIGSDGVRIGVTPTCAANALRIVPDGAFAAGDTAAARLAFERIGQTLGVTAEALATDVLERATEKLRMAIDELVADYGLDRATVAIVGGGGGAAALLPFASRKLGYAFRLARNAEVISPLGVALALVRDVVERTIVDPTPADLLRIRREALDAAVAAGAAPEGIEVTIDIDRTRNRVRATASGATALVEGAVATTIVDAHERAAIAARFLAAPPAGPPQYAGAFALYSSPRARGRNAVCVVDQRGVVRAVIEDAHVRLTTPADVDAALAAVYERFTRFGDVGRALPDVRIVYASRLADLGGVVDVDQAVALARDELAGCDPSAVVAVVAAPRSA
jgi:N-methylhydantoinase A/oxoprolinase/acetone carboxylase beta subunit